MKNAVFGVIVTRLASCVLTALSLSCSIAVATQVRPVNLEQMTARADAIFAGRCVDVEIAPDPALGGEVAVVTFDVHRAVKGIDRRTISVRVPRLEDAGAGTAGSPGFREGDEVVLFLYGKSPMGLRAPVGLGQGRFRVVHDKQGRPAAINDLGNRNLLQGLSASARGRLGASFDLDAPGDQLSAADLLDMVEALLAQESGAGSGRVRP